MGVEPAGARGRSVARGSRGGDPVRRRAARRGAADRRGRVGARRRRADRGGASSCSPRSAQGSTSASPSGRPTTARTTRSDASTGFSSQGLAFDGSIKPNVVAPGVALATAEPGAAQRRLAALRHGERDEWRCRHRRRRCSAARADAPVPRRPALAEPARRLLRSAVARRRSAVGAGVFRLGAAAVGEVAAQPSTLGFGIWGGPHWHATQTIVVRNVSTRRLQLSFSVVTDGESEALQFKVEPNRLLLPVGRARTIKVTRHGARGGRRARRHRRRSRSRPQAASRCACRGRSAFRQYSANLLAHVALNKPSFEASDTTPALLTIQAGNLVRDDGLQVQPVVAARHPALLGERSSSSACSRGCATCCPAPYSFGITGRGPTSVRARARPLRAAARGLADAAEGAEPSRARVPLHDQVDSRPMATATPESHLRENPFQIAQQQLYKVADTFGIDQRPDQRPAGVQEGGRGLDPDVARRRRRQGLHAATASRTTSRAARRRAASATTRTSRSTRSRRSRCG